MTPAPNQGPVFTAQDLQNILNLISKAPIIGEEAETVMVLQLKLRQSIELIPAELPADTVPMTDFVETARVPSPKKDVKKPAAKKAKKG